MIQDAKAGMSYKQKTVLTDHSGQNIFKKLGLEQSDAAQKNFSRT